MAAFLDQVEYADNTAGASLTNTHNWEYVGKTAYAAALTVTSFCRASAFPAPRWGLLCSPYLVLQGL